MKDAQKPDHVSLNTLISHLKEGRFVIPDFQREFEWKPWDIKDLMRSIFLDYYIGSLLLWKGTNQNFDSLSCEVIYGFKNKPEQASWNYDGGNPEHIVLDGQQRLTALYYAFVAPEVALPHRANRAVYYIHVDKFMEEEYDQAFEYAWVSRRFAKVLGDRETQYREHIFPLRIIGAGHYDLPNWLQGYEEYWQDAAADADERKDGETASRGRTLAKNAELFGKHVMEIAEQYQIAYVELDKELAIDKVCDIFTKINSTGSPLSVFDLINALLKPKGLQLKHMWREAASRLEFVDTSKMDVYVLQVMSIISQAYCSSKYLYFLLPGQPKQVRDPDGTRRQEVLIKDVQDFEARWLTAVDAMEDAIKKLRHPQEFGAIASRFLPYVSILPAFAALQARIKSLDPTRQLDAQRKIRHWYWASVFTNRYSGAVESTTARDFQDVCKWFDDTAAEPDLLLEFKKRFRDLELRRETKRGTSVYNGIFNLLVLNGAKDWVNGSIPQPDDLDDHHIVPNAWGRKHLKGDAIHTILNRTPLTADTNRKVISDRLPNEYLPQLIAANSENQVRTILESHFISPVALEILLRDPFTADDFSAFISERQRTIQDGIESLLIKDRLDLSAPLRELDMQIEKSELGLRRYIVSTLDDDPQRLPSHVLQKLEEVVAKAAKKNATIDVNDYVTLEAKLEYADLRELQETITSKATWDCFESRFVNKETLNAKFGQLAELRNGIRHSRTVDEVTRKEGEAAILWFNEVLSK
jgi:hypothetical protein